MDRTVFYLVLLASSTLVTNVASNQGATEPASLSAQLDRIEAKLDTLNKTITRCGCTRSDRFSRQTSEARLHSSPESDATRSTSSEHERGDPKTRLTHFNQFNRLADNLNSIAPDGVDRIELDKKRGDVTTGSRDDGQLATNPTTISESHQLIASLEALLGDAFDNLNLIMREQLVGFRLTLNKLIGLLSDHNFQHVALSNQLAGVQEECSIAASQLNSKSNTLAAHQDTLANSGGANCTERAANSPNALRSSDAIVLAHLLSDNLEHLIRKSISSSLLDPQQQRPSSCHTDHLREQEDQLRLETTIGRGLSGFQRRLDEIYSVLKQAANNVNSLRSSQTALMDQHQTQQTTTTIVYTNDQQADQTSANPLNKPIGRWYAGSKVPNQRPTLMVANSSDSGDLSSRFRSARQDQIGSATKCQTETNLKRPRSCHELYEAGANCTGQYYIFVQGVFKRVYCEMSQTTSGDDQLGAGGWTVVLRRLDKSLAEPRHTSEPNVASSRASWLDQIKSAQMDFDQDWQAYRSGFGTYEDWSEFFMGLDLLHQLTNSSEFTSSELQLDLQANDTAELHLKFDNFSIGPESDQFRFIVGACNLIERPEFCSPITRLNMSIFQVHSQQQADATNLNSFGGWWQPQGKPADGAVRLTGPIGGPDRHLYWPGWSAPGDQTKRALRRIVMKVRSRRAATPARTSRMTRPIVLIGSDPSGMTPAAGIA